MSPSSSSSSATRSLLTRAAAAIVVLFLIATLTNTITTATAAAPLRQQLQVLRFEDLPDLDAEQAGELGLDLNIEAAKPQTLTLSAVRPLAVATQDDASEFARWMLEDTDSTLNFGTGSGDVDASTGEEWVESSSGSSELSSSASAVIASSSASTVASSTGASESSPSSSAGVVIVPASSLVLSSSNVQAYVSYGSVSVSVTSVVGALPMLYAVSPSLPTGLSLSTSTGSITGTATAVSSSTVYTITASNAAIGGGSTTASLTLAVSVRAPVSLTLSSNKVTMASGLHSTITATVAGSPCTFTVTPSLPTGLSLNAATGVISGTPSLAQSARNYTVTATNAAGSLTASVSITVTSASALPPYGLAYPVVAGRYYKDEKISANIPVVYGAGTFVFSISPPTSSLPSGLTFSYTSGLIKGTPVVQQAATTYTITVTTAYGSVSTAISIEVVARPPTIVYPVNPASLVVNSMFSTSPTVAGTRPLTFAITPTLPAGLTFQTETGAIAGAPTAAAASATYTVTATNSGGSASVAVVIMVATTATPPSALSYSPSRVDFPTTVSAVVTPTVSGTTPMAFTVSPLLVAGLSLNAVTGAITGTATQATSGDVVYTVTATNAAGSTTATVTVSVTVVPVARLVYASRFGRFVVGTSISDVPSTYPVVGTSAAGDLTFTTSVLPTGITLNSTTGEMAGTPTETSEAVTYTITASNSQGSLSQSVQIRVVAASAAPPPRQATVAFSLPGLTAATFTPTVQATLLQEFADRLGLAVSLLKLQAFTSSAHAFRVQADSLSVRIIIDLETGDDATSGDASAVTAYLNEQLEADEFSLASFPGMGIDTNPAPLSSTGGVDSTSSGASGDAAASSGSSVEQGQSQQVSNSFKWSSLGGALLIVFIVLVAIVVLLLLGKFVLSRRSPHEKLFADHEQVQTVVVDSGAGAPAGRYGAADDAASPALHSGAFGGVEPAAQQAERRTSAAGFHYTDAV